MVFFFEVILCISNWGLKHVNSVFLLRRSLESDKVWKLNCLSNRLVLILFALLYPHGVLELEPIWEMILKIGLLSENAMPISSSWHKLICENKNKNDWIVCNPFLISMIYFLNWWVSSNLKFMLNLQNDPELAQAVLGNDLNKLQDLLRERHRQKSDLRRQQEEELVSFLSGGSNSFSCLAFIAYVMVLSFYHIKNTFQVLIYWPLIYVCIYVLTIYWLDVVKL